MLHYPKCEEESALSVRVPLVRRTRGEDGLGKGMGVSHWWSWRAAAAAATATRFWLMEAVV